eukprot:m.19932 g.19932  ORF g.19932 m.19932 type:complete len:430 (+) comp5194_c0_seq2:47-1336(+)
MVVYCLVEGGGVIDSVWKDGPFLVVVDDDNGVISDIVFDGDEVEKQSKEAQYTTEWILPGFVDIHNHGIGGSEDILGNWTNPSYSLSRFPQFGVTSVLASLIPTDLNVLKQCLAVLIPYVGKPDLGAVCEGFHFEGPVIKDLGALPHGETDPTEKEFADLIDLCEEHLKIMTISPSLEAAFHYKRLRILLEKNVRPSLGHDKSCTFDDILGALDVASSFQATSTNQDCQLHITHLFNVSTFHHRNPSLVNFGLCSKIPSKWKSSPEKNLQSHVGNSLTSPSVEIIADGIHVHDITLMALLSARTPQDIAVITDNILHCKPGLCSNYCDREVEVAPDGQGVYLKGTNTLAGSSLSLWDAFKKLVLELDVSIADASNMLTLTPARIARIANSVGSVSVGMRANFLLVDSSFILNMTFIHGKPFYASPTTTN